MSHAERFTLLVPVYQEALDLPDTLTRIDAALQDRSEEVELLFVDDASTDGSSDLLHRYLEARPNARLVRHPVHRGLHPALRTGLAQARTGVVVFMEAHAPHAVSAIFELVDRLGPDVDLVAARRRPREDPLWRRAGSWAVNTSLRLLYPIPLHDLQCLLSAWRIEAARTLWNAGSFAGMLRTMSRLNARELDVPHLRPRVGGSHYSLGRLTINAVEVLYGAVLAGRRGRR